MSVFYNQLLKDKEDLEKAKCFALLKKAHPNDMKSNRVSFSLQRMLDSLDLGTSWSDISKAGNQVRNMRGEKEDLSRKIDGDLVNGLIKQINEAECLSELSAEELVNLTRIMALILIGEDLKTSQIRKFFSGVRRIETNSKRGSPQDFNRDEVVYLKVFLAYTAGRQQSVRPLLKVVEVAIDKIREEPESGFNDFKAFVHLVEGIVAFHKYYGGSE